MVELTFFSRPSYSSLQRLKELAELREEYINEDIYQYYITNPSPQALSLIEEARLVNLFLTSQKSIPERSMYTLFPLLIALINNFFAVEVSTFSIYGIADTLRLLPLDKEGKGVYAISSKVNYFLYYVRLEDLAEFYYIGTNYLLEGKSLPSLFGVYFWNKEKRAERLAIELENLTQTGVYEINLPKKDLLEEIASSFHLKAKERGFRKLVLRRGSFWTELGKEWLEEAWRMILEERLPLLTVYYIPEDVEGSFPPERTKNLLILANYILTGSRRGTSDSLTFPVTSMEEIKKLLDSLAKISIERWFSYASAQPMALQRAIEKKFPQATTLNLEGIVAADIPSTSTFTPQEIEEAEREVEEGNLPKEYFINTPREISLPPLLDKKGEAYVEVEGKEYNLLLPYEELKDIWSPAIISPWGKVQLERGSWSRYWFK